MTDSNTTIHTGTTDRRRSVILGLALAALLSLTAGFPLAQADFHGPSKDLSVTVDAGDYMAYQVEMPTSGWVYVGGEYLDAEATDAVLPIVNFVDRLGDGFIATTGFYYDAYRDNVMAADVTINEENLGDHNVHTHEKTIAGSPFPALYMLLPPGTYNMVGLTGPADGEAELWLEVPHDAIVHEQKDGEATWARGVDESAVGYEGRARLGCYAYTCLLGNSAEADYYEWYYSGADVEIDVEGALYGYMGFNRDTLAHWQDPQGPTDDTWILAGEPGTWTMSFPEEHWQWRNCISVLCAGDESARWKVYPPFAVAVDLEF